MKLTLIKSRYKNILDPECHIDENGNKYWHKNSLRKDLLTIYRKMDEDY